MKETSIDEHILREKLTYNGKWDSDETVKFTKLTGEHLFPAKLETLSKKNFDTYVFL